LKSGAGSTTSEELAQEAKRGKAQNKERATSRSAARDGGCSGQNEGIRGTVAAGTGAGTKRLHAQQPKFRRRPKTAQARIKELQTAACRSRLEGRLAAETLSSENKRRGRRRTSGEQLENAEANSKPNWPRTRGTSALRQEVGRFQKNTGAAAGFECGTKQARSAN